MLLLDADAGEVTITSNSWTFPRAHDAPALGFDLELDSMWSLIGQTSRECLQACGASAAEVVGVAVTALRFGTVILDGSGGVKFAVPNRDARGTAEFFQLVADHGDAILAETGLWPMPIHASARLEWLKKNKPEVISASHRLLSLSDWANFRLCGVVTSDVSQAGCTGLFNLVKRAWDWDRIDAMEFPREMFGDIRSSGELLGGLSSEAARDLGLLEQTPVSAAGSDTQCGLLGVGATQTGDVAVVAGTTAPVQAVCEAAAIDPAGRLWSGHHVVPGKYVLESNGGPMGETLSWMSRLLYPDAADPEARLFAEASTAEVGAGGMLSTFGAEVMNARAPSIPFGQITLTHMTSVRDASPRRFLARAVVEGYACAVRANLEQLGTVTSDEPQRLHLAGGMSQSAVFAQLIANVLNLAVVPSKGPASTALGAAICAAVGAGLYRDVMGASEALAQTGAEVLPEVEFVESNAALYASWLGLRAASAESTTPAAMAHITPWALRMSD